METIIDLRILDPRFRSGLIFSFFEGLVQGGGFKLIFDYDPQEIKNHFLDLKILNAELSIEQKSKSLWEMNIRKNKGLFNEKKSSDCCGVCGGEGD